jgi:hypothetical protein
LISDLTFRDWVVASMARVNDLVTRVAVIDIPSGHDDGVRTIDRASRNARLKWTMYARCTNGATVRELSTDPGPGDVPKDSFCRTLWLPGG